MYWKPEKTPQRKRKRLSESASRWPVGDAATPVEGGSDTGNLDREGSAIFLAKNCSSLSGSHPGLD